MRDDELRELIENYLTPPSHANLEMVGVEIVWERNDARLGSRHIYERHGVSEEEVEEVLTQIPPYVEAKRHSEYPNRTVFWGATRYDRWLFVVCEDWAEGCVRFLKPITALEPLNGVEYWERIT